MFKTNRKTIVALFVIMAVFMSATACASNAVATDSTVVPTVAVTVTTNEPTETAAVATPTPTPEVLEAAAHYLAAVKDADNSLCGYIDKKGDYVIEPQFDWAGGFVKVN